MRESLKNTGEQGQSQAKQPDVRQEPTQVFFKYSDHRCRQVQELHSRAVDSVMDVSVGPRRTKKRDDVGLCGIVYELEVFKEYIRKKSFFGKATNLTVILSKKSSHLQVFLKYPDHRHKKAAQWVCLKQNLHFCWTPLRWSLPNINRSKFGTQ